MTPAGWLADPFGRHQHRYWDGTAWTDHVADQGVTAIDPPTAMASPPLTPPTAATATFAPPQITPSPAPEVPARVLPEVPRYPTTKADASRCSVFRWHRHWYHQWYVPEFDEQGAVITSERETRRGDVVELPVSSITEQMILEGPPNHTPQQLAKSEPNANCRLVLTDQRLILLAAPPTVRFNGFKKVANAVGSVAWAVGSIGELNLVDLAYGPRGRLKTADTDVMAGSIPLLQIDGLNFGKSSVSIVMSYRWGASRGFPVQMWTVPIDESHRERTLQFFDDLWARMHVFKREVLRPQLHEANQAKFDSFVDLVHAPGTTRASPFTTFQFDTYGRPRLLTQLLFARDGHIDPIPPLAECRFGRLTDAELLHLRTLHGRHFLLATAALRAAGVAGLPDGEFEWLDEVCERLSGGADGALTVQTMLQERGGNRAAR